MIKNFKKSVYLEGKVRIPDRFYRFCTCMKGMKESAVCMKYRVKGSYVLTKSVFLLYIIAHFSATFNTGFIKSTSQLLWRSPRCYAAFGSHLP